MTAHTPRPELETRLRAGLRAAGEALPPAPSPSGPPDPAARHLPDVPAARDRRTRTAALAAAAAAAVAVAGVGVVRLAGDGGVSADVESSPAPDPATTAASTTGGDHRGPGQDPVAGGAVVTGGSLVTYGPDGTPGETVPLAPLDSVQSVVPDRHGGWIACGARSDDVSILEEEAIPLETWTDGEVGSRELDEALAELEESAEPTVFRFRPGHEPEPLAITPWCMANALGVTLVEGRETLLYASGASMAVEQLDLTTGTTSSLPVDVGTPLPGHATVGGGRIAVLDGDGLRVWDLATGEPVSVAVAPVDLPVSSDLNDRPGTSELELSPDGATLAALVGDLSSSEVAVFDLATGAELFRATVPQSVEGDQLSYDGTSVAVGTSYEGGGPLRIFDVATGAVRTVDAYGVLP